LDGKGFFSAAAVLPAALRNAALALPEDVRADAEEFRLRSGQVPTVLCRGAERPIGHGADATQSAAQMAAVTSATQAATQAAAKSPHTGSRRFAAITQADLRTVLELATGASVHTAGESLKRGFVTVKGGCRVGICGTAAVQNGEVAAIRGISSVALRIPSERKGCADGLFGIRQNGGRLDASVPKPGNTLIISPPGYGKTTLLRELIRKYSDGGYRVSLADERGEIAACYDGEPQLDVGSHTDVMTGMSKAAAAETLLRAMNPQILALDELSSQADAGVCRDAANCGVVIFATAHASDADELTRRPAFGETLPLFSLIVTIKSENGRRTYSAIQKQRGE